MKIETVLEAQAALAGAPPLIMDECRVVWGGELPYQAVVYHCLRVQGITHRDEVRHRGGNMAPVMMVIDTAKDLPERMKPWAFSEAQQAAERHKVAFYYLSPDTMVPAGADS